MKTNLDPCRPVTWNEWCGAWHLREGEEPYDAVKVASNIVRYRVAEALADMVPKAQCEKAEARTSWAKLALGEIMDTASGTTIGSAFEDLEYIERIAKETILGLGD